MNIAIIARHHDRFTYRCRADGLDPADVIEVRRPDQLRGLSLETAVWDSTPFGWTRAVVDEALANIRLALRVGPNPQLLGNPPMTRDEAVHWLRGEVETAINETVGAEATRVAALNRMYAAFDAIGIPPDELRRLTW